MLRINYAQTETERRWTLCGHLAGAWVPELHGFWEPTHAGADGLRAVVDLSDVTFIDENGEKLLREMRGRGVEFVARGVDTRHLLESLKAEDARPLRRFISPTARGCDYPREREERD